MSARKAWIPDAAFVCAVLTLVYCLVLADGWRQLFRDSDTGWHIRNGEQILQSHALPFTDPYSFTRAGEPWFAWEWGADLVMAVASKAGLAGVAALYAVAIAAATWMWWQLTWVSGGDFLLAWLFASPMLTTTNLHWLARPHIFGWLFALAAVWMVERRAKTSLLAVGALSVAWTNVHASFLLFPAILLLYAFGEWIAPKLFQTMERESRGQWLLIAAGVATLGTLVNPNGWRVHDHVIRYLTDKELIDRIGEFQTFNFHSEGSLQILLAVGLSAAGGVLALVQGRVSQFLLAAFLLALGLRSARGLPLIALLLLPLANAAIVRALAQGKGLRASVAERLRRALRYSARLREFDKEFSGWALAPVLLVLLGVLVRAPAVQAHAGFSPSEFPVAAAREVEKLPLDARILAPDKFGGYLIYRFDGQRKVFFDGRSDFYGAAFMKNYIELVEVRPNWQEELAKHRFTYALLPNHYSLIPALEQRGWRRLYNDEVATLLAR